MSATTPPDAIEKATFAGGCFWCMEPPFDGIDGVLSTTSGYAGGHVEDPSYEQVCTGNTGHAEVVQIEYDPDRVSYETLLAAFWHNIDPTDGEGQFADRGDQYRTAIFVHDEKQKELAEASKRELEASDRFSAPIVTRIEPLGTFYPAEEKHQNFYQTNPVHYKRYKMSCGRPERLKEIWGEKAGAIRD